MRLLLAINSAKPGALDLAAAITQRASAHGAHVSQTTTHPLTTAQLADTDAVLTIGGDGTLLSAVAACAATQTPIIGVNLGKLGFLATYNPDTILDQLPQILQGQHHPCPRSLLSLTLADGSHHHALNDIVLKTQESHLCTLALSTPTEEINHYRADGLIFATPSGSSAYNLSAGGPLVHPFARVITITPICPHTLSNRTLIIDDKTPLKVQLLTPQDKITISLDGAPVATDTHFPLQIALAPTTLSLIQPPNHSHYQILRSKLGWG